MAAIEDAGVEWLVDTNVISELAKPNPNSGVVQWAESIRKIAISVITLEEIEFGLTWRPYPKIQSWLSAFYRDYCEIIQISHLIARQSGRLRGQLQAAGKTCHQADMLIAATATIHGLTLVTRNEKDFVGTGCAVLNPFT